MINLKFVKITSTYIMLLDLLQTYVRVISCIYARMSLVLLSHGLSSPRQKKFIFFGPYGMKEPAPSYHLACKYAR